jgi:hypothetical protein
VTLALNPATLAVCALQPMTVEPAVSQVPAHFSEILVETVNSAARLITDLFDMPITLTAISHINISFYHKYVNQH